MEGDTKEFYPGLVSFTVRDDHAVEWTDDKGVGHIDMHAEFHGGPGQVLTFRLWSRAGIERSLKEAGYIESRDDEGDGIEQLWPTMMGIEMLQALRALNRGRQVMTQQRERR